MYFVGVDLAWGVRNPTGVAVRRRTTAVWCVSAHSATTPTCWPQCGLTSRTIAWSAFDAPLVVTNPTGQRPAETALNRDFRRFEAGAHPSTPESPNSPTVRAPRAWPGRWTSTWTHGRPRRGAPSRSTPIRRRWRCSGLPRTLKYKAKPGRDLDQLKSELLLLMDGVEGLAHAAGAATGRRSASGRGCAGRWLAAQRKSDLRRAEDPIDAVVCAYVALYAERCPDDITIYGDFATGYIVTPSLPADLVPSVRSAPDAGRSVRARRRGRPPSPAQP